MSDTSTTTPLPSGGRSWLFVPGNNPKYLAKARDCDASVLLVDLEDGVLPENKQQARTMVREFVAGPSTPLRFVRVNAVETGMLDDDLDAVVVPGISGICLPKVDSPRDIEALSAQLDALERDRGMDPGSVRILAAVESARSLLAAPAIASADPRVIGLIFGAEDFALDLGLLTNRQFEAADLGYARSAIVVAAVSAGVASVDGVYPKLDSEDGLLAEARRSRDLGFTGKSTFSPRQLPLIHSVFQPDVDEVDYSRRVVAAFEHAATQASGSAIVDGQLVDLPIVMRARRVLALAGPVAT